MSYTSVFEHPVKGIFPSIVEHNSLELARAAAEELSGSDHYGRHLYTRPTRQVPMRTDERYVIAFSKPASYFKYRLECEDLFGSFDYYRIGEHGYDVLDFIVVHQVDVPDAGITSDVRLRLRFKSARSGKFERFCLEHLVAIELDEGKAFLRGYPNIFATSPSAQIELDIIR